MWKLFLDDVRDPYVVYPTIAKDLVIARTYDQATKMILQLGIPNFIGFDHDLGEESSGSGYDLAMWLVNNCLDNNLVFPTNFKYNVHSANPVGAANIRGLLDGYFKSKRV